METSSLLPDSVACLVSIIYVDLKVECLLTLMLKPKCPPPLSLIVKENVRSTVHRMSMKES